ncbi:MAG: hypothetical protein WC414_04295 [Patescibacteria group bacterium]
MKATNIVWETDGEDIALPSEVEIPDNIVKPEDYDECSIANYLSSVYGWLVSSLEIIK